MDGSIVAPPPQNGSGDARAYSGRCMISASSYDQSCAVDTDCTSVTSTNYCSVNCLCGGSAINVGARAQFNEDVSKTPLGSGALGAATALLLVPWAVLPKRSVLDDMLFAHRYRSLPARTPAGRASWATTQHAVARHRALRMLARTPTRCAASPETAALQVRKATGTPTISITSPSEGQTVAAGQPPHSPAWIVSIGFNVTNFTLMPAGTCSGGAANSTCGHVQVYVDGSACTPMGEPDNNMAFNGPNMIDAYLNSCPTVSGSHTVSLELHRDDGSPLDGPNGTVIRAQVTFTATGG